jgi:release factor glutamine methyltransferase
MFLIHINKNSMKIKEYSQFIQELLSAYDAGEAESFLSDTRRESVKKDRFGFGSRVDFFGGELALWNSILEQLKLEIPIQYLLGALVFMV